MFFILGRVLHLHMELHVFHVLCLSVLHKKLSEISFQKSICGAMK